MNPLKILAAALVALALTSQARSADIPLPRDGWVSWQVEAVEDAAAFCCWSSWGEQVGEPQTCDLDGNNQAFGTRDHAKTDAARVYARFKNGKLERLHTLAAACPVSTKTPIQKLDNVSTDDSARWLTGLTLRDDLDEEVLSSLA